jgi:hypothetical protein
MRTIVVSDYLAHFASNPHDSTANRISAAQCEEIEFRVINFAAKYDAIADTNTMRRLNHSK